MSIAREIALPETDFLHCIARRLAGLTGWRRHAAAAGLGGLATLALPPAYAVPLLLIAFPGLLWLMDGVSTQRGAFFTGWWFGFGHFLLGLYWVSFALFVDIETFWWLLPFAAAGLPLVLAIFTGLATLTLHGLGRRCGLDRGLARLLAFAVLWTLFEWLRGHAFTGFPWNLTGYSWVGFLPVLQATAYVGVYGLGLLTVLVAAAPALLADQDLPRYRAVTVLTAGLGLFAAIAAAGAVRLGAADHAMVPGVMLRLVQPNIDQRLKWQPRERQANFIRHLDLSAAPGADRVTHVFWPETAVTPYPNFLEMDMQRRLAIAAVTPRGGLTVTGTPRMTMDDGPGMTAQGMTAQGMTAQGMTAQGATAQPAARYWNGLVAIDETGALVASYDKFHLVPFGEYMPLRRWLPVNPIAAGTVDFSAASGPVTLELPGLPPVSPLICYEAIFPGAVKDPAHRPRWLLNLTNDGWYGLSAGPHQHFAIARVRAVEEGLPLVRVANTGISGVVDAYGRNVAQLGLGEYGVVDSPLPVALAQSTLYGNVGDWILVVMLMSCSLGVFLARHR